MSSCVASKVSGSGQDRILAEAEDRLREKDRGRLERLPRPLNLKNSLVASPHHHFLFQVSSVSRKVGSGSYGLISFKALALWRVLKNLAARTLLIVGTLGLQGPRNQSSFQESSSPDNVG